MSHPQKNVSFMTQEEINEIGFGAVGKNVLISKKASFYSPATIFIGDNVRIDDFCLLSGKISLGHYVHIAAFAAIFAAYGVVIGDFSGISIRTTILSATDDISGDFLGNPMIETKFRNVTGKRIELKKYSWVGAHCLLLPGAFINEGTALGASSVLRRSTEPWMIYMGNPAVKLQERSTKMLDMTKELGV